MSEYPDLFYRYAFSGQAKCHGCKTTIKQGQFVYVVEGNVFHDSCSENMEGRKRLEEKEASK
jgi:hypothetical protein